MCALEFQILSVITIRYGGLILAFMDFTLMLVIYCDGKKLPKLAETIKIFDNLHL